MAEREVLGQGVVELLLEDSKLKPSLAAVKKLIEDTLGPAVGNALGGGGKGGGKRGALAGMAASAARDAARAGKAISKGISDGVVQAAKSGTVLTKSLGNVANQASSSAGRMASSFIQAAERSAKSGARAGASMADSIAKGSAKAVRAGSKAAGAMASDWSKAAARASHAGSRAATKISSDMSKSASRMSGTFGNAISAVSKRINSYSREFGKAAGRSSKASRSIIDDMQGQERQAGRLRRMLGRLSGGFRGATGAGMGFGSMLGAVAGGNLIATMVTKLTMGLKDFISAGFRSAGTLETLSVSFAKLVGSEKIADNLLGTLRAFSSRTPLQFQDVTKASVALLATQKVAQDDLIPTLQKLTDVAAGSTEGFAAFPRVVRGITQMLSKGRIQAEEMLQLAEAGVPAWDALANEMGMSISQVRKLGEEGKLGIDAIHKLIDGLGNKYAGLAKKQSKTFMGLVSTLRDQINVVSQGITKPFFELAKVNLDNLVTWLSTDKATAFFKTIESGVSKVARVIEAGINSPIVRTIAVIGGVAAAAVTMAAGFASAVALIGSVLNPLTLTIGGIAAGVMALGMSFKKALNSPVGREIRENLAEIRDLGMEIGTNVVETIKAGWSSVKDAIGGAFSFNTDQFWLAATRGVRDFLDFVSLMSSDWGAAWEYMKARSIGALLKIRETINKWTGGISEVIIAGVGLWWGEIKRFGSFVVETFGKIWSWVSKAVGGMSASIGGLSKVFTIDNFVRGIGAMIGAGKAFVSQMRAFFIEIGNIASAAASGIYEVFKKQFERLAVFADSDTWLDPAKMKAAIGGLFQGANPVGQAQTFMDAFNKTLASQEQPDFLNYSDTMRAEGEALVKMLADFRSKMSGSNTEGIAEAEQAMKAALDKMRKSRDRNRKVRDAGEDVVKVESEHDDDVVKGMKGLKDEVKGKDLFGKTDIGGLHDAVQDALNKGGDPALDEAKKQTDVLEDIRDGKGRGSDANPVEDIKDAVNKSSRSAADKARDILNRNLNKSEAPGKSAADIARDVLNKNLRDGDAKNASGKSGDDKVNVIDEIKKNLADNLANRGDASGDPMRNKDLFEAMRKTLNEAGVSDTRRQVRDHEAFKITDDPEKYAAAMDAKKRAYERRQANLAAAEETRKRVLNRKIEQGTATARDYRRPLTEWNGRSATELGRTMQQRNARNLEDHSMARMIEQFTETAKNTGLVEPGVSALDLLKELAPIAKMDGVGGRDIELQKAMLDELRRQGGSSEQLAAAFQATGDKIVNNMGYGD